MKLSDLKQVSARPSARSIAPSTECRLPQPDKIKLDSSIVSEQAVQQLLNGVDHEITKMALEPFRKLYASKLTTTIMNQTV